MKKKTLRALSMLLTVIMIGGMLLTSCRETPVETTTEFLEETTEKKTESTASEKTESTSTETDPSEVTDGHGFGENHSPWCCGQLGHH